MPSSFSKEKSTIPADLPTVLSPSTCVRKGFCPMTTRKGHSFELYFEQHGRGSQFKILMIMGFASSLYGAIKQVEWFGGGKAFRDDKDEEGGDKEKSTVLVFDNRSVGRSGYPRGPHTISAMADDTISLLDHVGWTGEREVHVVGISMGGMIAQELACKIPDRIRSLTLAVTSPGGSVWNNIPPLKGVAGFVKLMFTPDPVKMSPIALNMVYAKEWLDEPDVDEPNRTNRDVQTEIFLRRFVVTKKQRKIGYIYQLAAVLRHYVSPDKLKKIGETIPSVAIMTGDEDYLMKKAMSRLINDAMPNAEFAQMNNTGHGIEAQRFREFNAVVERTILRTSSSNNDLRNSGLRTELPTPPPSPIN